MTRARDLGIPLRGSPGPWNAITDVPGVTVGHLTLIEGASVRTGVTAILPRGAAGAWRPCAAGTSALNGNGEMTGTAWIAESGALASPVVLTNTHAVGAGHRGVIDWTLRAHPGAARRWLLPVVAETYDGYLNDVNGDHVHPAHVVRALDDAASGPVAEGSVGGGTGMTCYDFKGGAGTASRVVRHGADTYTVGAYVQANFGSRPELVVAGVPVGTLLGDAPRVLDELPPGAGSVIAVIATDAPLLPDQCRALARRVPLGLARTGTAGSHFSGDLFLAFSVANEGALAGGAEGYQSLRFVPWDAIDPFFTAVVEAVEESVLNALINNRPMTGRAARHIPALPHPALRSLLP